MKGFLRSIVFAAVGIVLLPHIGCKKDSSSPGSSQGEREILLRLSEFEAMVEPLGLEKRAEVRNSRLLNSISTTAGNVVASAEPQLLYLWTFNNENTVADIGIDTVSANFVATAFGASTSFEFTAGYAYSPHPAGKALSMTGPKSITVELPWRPGIDAHDLAFDISSSGTGPKGFNLSYSVDGGTNFQLLEEENQLENTKANAKNSFVFDLSMATFPSGAGRVLFRLDFLEGERGDAGSYNKNTGTAKIDNLRLTGVYDEETFGSGRLHYHFFDLESGALAKHGSVPLDLSVSEPIVRLSLPDGNYAASFVSDFSEIPLIFSETLSMDQFSIQKSTKTKNGSIFGELLPSMRVERDMEVELLFNRYYGEISFHFTDEDLSTVDRLEIFSTYSPKFFPFNDINSSDAGTEDVLTIRPDFASGTTDISFQQFVGIVPESVPVSYELAAFDHEGNLLRRFEVTAPVKNNVRIIFTGKLLGSGASPGGDFKIRWIEAWDDEQNMTF